MRRARLRGEGTHFVHAISRVVDRRFILGDQEKEHFVNLMLKLSNFSGIRVVSWCVLDNHFHLLLEQPDLEERVPLSPDEVFRRLSFIYTKERIKKIKGLHQAASRLGPDQATRFLEPYEKRMGDVSVFMKELKQRFSQWYNRRNDRRGTLWEERFKSVLVEGSEEALMTIAAYIDLNPVRAGLVDRPEDYRWCSYARAVAGDAEAREGLGRILDFTYQSVDEFETAWEATSQHYRLWLFNEGREVTPDPELGIGGRKGFKDEAIEREERREGRLTRAEQLRCRVRYFTEGAVLGSTAFVERVFEQNREHFGRKRKNGARKMRGGNWGGLRVARDLKVPQEAVPT